MFKDRKAAGLQLAGALKKYQHKKPLILGIPRGGVEVAYYVANELKASLSVVVSRKLGYPDHSEAAFGALAEDGSLYLNPRIQKLLTRDMIERVMERTQKEIDRRVKLYRKGQPLPNMDNRTVILVDDGIATGSTLFAAIELCKKQKPKIIIVAAPVSSRLMLRTLQNRVHDAIILQTPGDFYAVSQQYEKFPNLTDKQVLHFLNSDVDQTTSKSSG
ncbi:phosphoribosyltransferase [Aliifodinibius sp. S!AR15-10]|uniref:phosphoribosyltransferase n=1 Tax=Aliifodinibius sp. S!AR15-10 TaxID=2950437 RepID=UPI002862A99F|nr:phosphoribosyltransferase family protein [Aliifodinibius sp. S!AR15-10]MDR8394005.1 phosphoribosyltransferase [Aliifodinibius sp. S!AR15-10]